MNANVHTRQGIRQCFQLKKVTQLLLSTLEVFSPERCGNKKKKKKQRTISKQKIAKHSSKEVQKKRNMLSMTIIEHEIIIWLRLWEETGMRFWMPNFDSKRLQHLLPFSLEAVCTVLVSLHAGAGGVYFSVIYSLTLWDTAMVSVNATNACVVVVWTTLTSWCRQACDKEKLCYTRNEDTASVHCWKWGGFNNLLHTWHQSTFFFSLLRKCTNFASRLLLICTEALKIICRAGARCWISEGCFCWFRGKSILQHVQPAKCPISAVKKKVLIEAELELHSVNSGAVLAKVWHEGINDFTEICETVS